MTTVKRDLIKRRKSNYSCASMTELTAVCLINWTLLCAARRVCQARWPTMIEFANKHQGPGERCVWKCEVRESATGGTKGAPCNSHATAIAVSSRCNFEPGKRCRSAASLQSSLPHCAALPFLQVARNAGCNYSQKPKSIRLQM